MKKTILLLIGLIFIALVAIFSYGLMNSSDRQVSNLPWQISLDARKNPQVLGLTIGETTLDEATRNFRHLPELAIFHEPDGQYRLEAYYGKIYVGVFEARIIATLEASQNELQAMTGESPKRNPMPSGSYEYTLNETQLLAAGSKRITRLSYSPVVNLEAEQISRFFGEPAERSQVGESGEYWFYPDRSTMVLIEQDNKELFYYVRGEDYDSMASRLKAVGAEISTGRTTP